MNRLFSTVAAVALLLGLGALAVLARPGAYSTLGPARFASALAAPVAQEDTTQAVAPDAPETINRYNNLALPLNSQPQFTGLGLAYNAYDLGKFIGTPGVEVLEVRKWNPAAQAFLKCTLLPDAVDCSDSRYNFALELAGNYMVQVSSSLTPTVASFVGDVPDAGSIHFNMVGGAPSCKWNAISLPLDRDAITKASELAGAIGGYDVVAEVRVWNPGTGTLTGSFLKCTIQSDGACSDARYDFATRIGYPYWVCLKSATTWPPLP